MDNHNGFDGIGIGGSLLTFVMLFIGILSVNQIAIIVAILAGLSTLVLNIIRTIKEFKNKENGRNKGGV